MDLRETHDGARHPWEVARIAFFSRVLAEAGVGRAACSVLDVGAGDAWFAAELAATLPAGSRVTCWDVGSGSADLERSTATVVRVAERFDVVLLLDVLEHVDDDAGFLSSVVDDCLRPSALVLVAVPAWQALYSEHDAFLQHRRRYSPRACRALLRHANLEIRQSGGLFHSLLAPRLVAKAAELAFPRRRRATAEGSSVRWGHGPLLTSAVGRALAVDNFLSRACAGLGVDLPGLSWWALCSR